MKKYKISKENINEFWDWFGKKKPKNLQTVIDDDPVLKQIDKNIQDIGGRVVDRLKKVKKERPEDFAQLVKYGLVPKDL